jgi:hypothetical protein
MKGLDSLQANLNRGFAAAQCGKAVPFRRRLSSFHEAAPLPLGGAAS